MLSFFQKYFAQFDIEAILMNLISIVLLYLFFLLLRRSIKFVAKKMVQSSVKLNHPDSGRQKTVIRLVENILQYTLVFFLIYCILAICGLPVSSLLAGAGIAGVAIGLGAQGFLSDLVNGFFILVERQFDVGDNVRLTNGPIAVAGKVVSVGIRTTQIRDADGTLHFIPNRNILVVSNKSRGDMRVQIDFPLSSTADLEAVDAVIKKVNAQHIPLYDAVKNCLVLGPQTSETGQFSYRIHLFVANGQQSQVYHDFYGFYQKALLESGLDLLASK
ncbi:mechanosensitive ion channel family protein [Streptococcus gallolyticus]|nr:mechanosensitive ion channel family protein [Streptococcus gallolyticus]MBY5040926.1 mechanosensitive ion channel family protein [Streptococcus gallolyticus]